MITAEGREDSPAILFHLRWVAKIALSVGAVAVMGMVAMLFVLTDSSGTSYGDLIKSRSVTVQLLGPALLIGHCFLLAFTAAVTWLIALYSSFRVAGPLFRMTRNLDVSISQGPTKPVPIRASDQLHEESALLKDSLEALASHYEALGAEVDQALRQMDAGEIGHDDRQAISARLQKRLEHART